MCKKIKPGMNYGPVLGSSGSSKSVTKHGQGSMDFFSPFSSSPKKNTFGPVQGLCSQMLSGFGSGFLVFSIVLSLITLS